MQLEGIVEYLEDKDITSDSNWYLHATVDEIERIQNILTDGIKCNYLLDQPRMGLNGLYYICLFKNSSESDVIQRYEDSVKFIISGIRPHHAISENIFTRLFSGTRIPIRGGNYHGEYQQYLRVDPSKFVGIDYSLSRVLPKLSDPDKRRKLLLLRRVTECVQEVTPELPIYDLASNKELNKDKILSLRI